MKKIFPVLDWILKYKPEYFKNDLVAGITVAILLIPQGMAYALIAGLPPVYGLYAALTPQIVYTIMGTSRQLAVGPVAMDSLLVAAGLGALSIVGTADYIQMAILLSLMVGIIHLILGIFKMGFFVSFLSKPVISGFTSGAAIIISLSQVKYLTGIPIAQNNKLQDFIFLILKSEIPIHVTTLILGLSCIFFLLFIKKLNKKIPSALVVVFFSTLWVYYYDKNLEGVAIIGEIPQGLPSIKFPKLDWLVIKNLFPIALTISIVAFTEAISISKGLDEKNKLYNLNPNQELLALGSANIFGSFFQSYPTTGGFSRTAVNSQAKAKTGVASLICALLIALTLSFFTDLFFYVPKTVLAAIIISAVLRLIDIKYAIRLYKSRKDEFAVLVLTFILTLFVGIIQGIFFGIILSLLLLVYRASKPHFAFLGRIGNTNYFQNIDRFPNEVVVREDLIILKFDAQLFFGNIDFFKKLVFNSIEKKPSKVKGFIINARAINYIDSTASEELIIIIKKLQKKELELWLLEL